MEEKEKTSQRVSLGKKELSTEQGQELLQIIEQIFEDGRINNQEIKSLNRWLEQIAKECSFAGIHFLREEVQSVLEDKNVSEPERRLLQRSLLRVLPPQERAWAKVRIEEAVEAERAIRKEAANKATEPQLAFLKRLGAELPANLSKDEASKLIDKLLEKSPTVRQRMVLRFWNRLDLSLSGVDGVSDWLDSWYDEDPDRVVAWDLWKKESGDRGGRAAAEIDKIPVGIGFQYLERVKKCGQSKMDPIVPTKIIRADSAKRSGCISGISNMIIYLAIISIGIYLVLTIPIP